MFTPRGSPSSLPWRSHCLVCLAFYPRLDLKLSSDRSSIETPRTQPHSSAPQSGTPLQALLGACILYMHYCRACSNIRLKEGRLAGAYSTRLLQKNREQEGATREGTHIFKPVQFGHHGVVRGGDVLVLVAALLDDGVVVDIAICSHSHCQGGVAPGLVLPAHVQRVLRHMNLGEGSCARAPQINVSRTFANFLHCEQCSLCHTTNKPFTLDCLQVLACITIITKIQHETVWHFDGGGCTKPGAQLWLSQQSVFQDPTTHLRPRNPSLSSARMFSSPQIHMEEAQILRELPVW